MDGYHDVLLDAVDQRRNQRGAQHGVLAGEILEGAAVVLDTSDVCARALLCAWAREQFPAEAGSVCVMAAVYVYVAMCVGAVARAVY